MQNKIAVLNVRIDAVTMEEAVSILEECIADKTPELVATANAEMIMLAQSDQELANILASAVLVVPDGAGVVWAARYHGYTVPERVAGYDLVQHLLAKSATKGYRVYMFGGAPGIVDQARKMAEKLYPGINIAGTHHGFFTASEEDDIINVIKSTKPDILLTALGVPKQEKWLAHHLHHLDVPVAVGVGGTFDVMAGTVKRAPLWMQRANLEWLFRLLSEPKRAIRMLALPRFVIRVIAGKKY